MKTLISIISILFMTTLNATAANYNLLDPGDVFYINDFGSNNRRVVVVRKLGAGSVKVRNLHSGESTIVNAGKLLTKAELDAQETGNAIIGTIGGAALLYCLFSPEDCKKK